MITPWPNKSPEPTASIAAVCSQGIWVCIDLGARWLSLIVRPRCHAQQFSSNPLRVSWRDCLTQFVAVHPVYAHSRGSFIFAKHSVFSRMSSVPINPNRTFLVVRFSVFPPSHSLTVESNARSCGMTAIRLHHSKRSFKKPMSPEPSFFAAESEH